jgi:hypothetical protein
MRTYNTRTRVLESRTRVRTPIRVHVHERTCEGRLVWMTDILSVGDFLFVAYSYLRTWTRVRTHTWYTCVYTCKAFLEYYFNNQKPHRTQAHKCWSAKPSAATNRVGVKELRRGKGRTRLVLFVTPTDPAAPTTTALLVATRHSLRRAVTRGDLHHDLYN